MSDHRRSPVASLPGAPLLRPVGDGAAQTGTARLHALHRALLAAASLILFSGCTTSVVPFEYRGKLVGKRLVKTERQPGFTVKLVKSSGHLPQLAFTGYEVVTHHEVPRYEKLLEYRPKQSTEDADYGSIRRELVPGEYIDGTVETRTERRELGPLADTGISLDGVAIRTNASGVYVDRSQQLLQPFDEPYAREVSLRLARTDADKLELTITRAEILASLGVSEETTPRNSRDGVHYSLTPAPEKPRPGDELRLTLTVQNKGKRSIDSVQARCISRHDWISGKNFYIGTLKPGEAKSFSRSFTVPNVAAPTVVFAAVGIRDRLGPASEHTVPVVLTLEPR